MLRLWQEECIATALLKYELGQTNFLAMATPGAGKTHMAAHLASQLFSLDKIDLVVCFTPSVSVNASFKESLEEVTARRMNGRMGSAGHVMTYHNLSFLPESFWANFDENRVFVIFDEIHHCGGYDLGLSNAWGEKILRNIRSNAAFTLALSGTPWRSDKLPIALAKYSGEPSRLECDYIYPLAQAIHDDVCRTPKVIAIDNDAIHFSDNAGNAAHYTSIRGLLSDTKTSYSDLLHNKAIVKFALGQAIGRLENVRKKNPQAGGLIVASSINHAYWISDILSNQLGERSVVVSHDKTDSHTIIGGFDESDCRWIISIGMVSEGTNIPRLQVCCYLSRIKTELYFRQVLGRILRVKKESYSFAYFYTLAEETLLEYARRIADDLPGHLSIVDIQHAREEVAFGEENEGFIVQELQSGTDIIKNSIEVGMGGIVNPEEITDNSKVSLFGQFFEELIGLQQDFKNI
jgi:superfamily II DNA or RNA helicase